MIRIQPIILHAHFNRVLFRGICTQEVQDIIMNINLQKSTIGIPQLCIKLACNYISEPLPLIFNESLCQGIVPDR